MQPHNPMLDTYRTLSGNVVDRVSPLLARSYILSENAKDSPNLAKAKTAWALVPKRLAEIETNLTNLGEAIFTVALDGRLTTEARTADIAALADTARQSINTATADVLHVTGSILEYTRADAYPVRPGPVDATQEAALAGIKADLRMVWDSVDADHTMDAMVDSLTRAIADDDKLALWLLASSRFPEDYLVSRGETIRRDIWSTEVAKVLDAASPDSLADARCTYNLLADGRHGLPLFKVLFNQLAPIINDVAQWRPSTTTDVPPTRVA